MKLFKRWTSGVVASFDWVADQVENHEALVAAAIREMQDAAAKARVQMQRVQKDGLSLREQLEKAEHDSAQWIERARRCSEDEREKALECVRRKKRSEQEAAALRVRLENHNRLEKQLKEDLDNVQRRLSELRHKKNSFLARKYNTEAQRAASMEHVGLMTEIDDIFERWELRLAQCEPIIESADSFSREFEVEEELESLEAELSAIKQGEGA